MTCDIVYGGSDLSKMDRGDEFQLGKPVAHRRVPVIRHALAQARMLLILVFYFSNYCMNCTSDELKTSNITRDIGIVTDSPPLPFMNLFKCRHAFSGVELA